MSVVACSQCGNELAQVAEVTATAQPSPPDLLDHANALTLELLSAVIGRPTTLSPGYVVRKTRHSSGLPSYGLPLNRGPKSNRARVRLPVVVTCGKCGHDEILRGIDALDRPWATTNPQQRYEEELADDAADRMMNEGGDLGR